MEYSQNGGTPALCALSKTLIEAGIATPEDWQKAEQTPFRLVRDLIVQALQGSAEYSDRPVEIDVCISDWTADGLERPTSEPTGEKLFLFIGSNVQVLLRCGDLYDEMYSIHPQLPVSFHHKWITTGIGRWVRVFDYEDLQHEIENLEGMLSGDGDDDAEDLETLRRYQESLPAYMTLNLLKDSEWAAVRNGLPVDHNVRKLMLLSEETVRASNAAQVPSFDWEEHADMLDGSTTTMPTLALPFKGFDSIRGLADQEAELSMQGCFVPYHIYPFSAFDRAAVENVWKCLRAFGDTLRWGAKIARQLPWADEDE